MNLIKSTSLLLSAIHTANAGLRGTATAASSRHQESMELASVSQSEHEEPIGCGPFHYKESKEECGPYHYKLSQAEWGELQSPGGGIKIAPKQLGFNMQFAVVEFGIGGVRDLHWHRKAAEWVYVSKGSCEFTLMDNNNRYVNGVAHTGDVWYFPLGWQHSIQAIDAEDGCTTLLWFDDANGAGSINLSDMMAAYPDDILKASLNDIPTDIISEFPEKQNSVALGTIQDDRLEPSDYPLDLWPVFPVDKGSISDSGEGGVEYAVRQEQMLATLTMSGGRIELEEGGMRELHWHTNADELHYVLEGCVRNIVHSNIDFPATPAEEYTICAGDIGYVPKQFVHYLEAVGGPATVIATFNHPSWGTQGLSGMMSVTPAHVTSSTLTTSVEVAEKYFPKESTAFIKKKDQTAIDEEDDESEEEQDDDQPNTENYIAVESS